MANIKKAIFKITSNVINLDERGEPDGAPEKDRLSADGILESEGGCVKLSYNEKREGSSVRCEIAVKGKEVSVRRRGDVVCDMLFSPEVTHKSVYQVPPFSFDMEIRALRIDNSLNEEGGALSLLYLMKVGGAEKRCRMKIEFSTDEA